MLDADMVSRSMRQEGVVWIMAARWCLGAMIMCTGRVGRGYMRIRRWGRCCIIIMLIRMLGMLRLLLVNLEALLMMVLQVCGWG